MASVEGSKSRLPLDLWPLVEPSTGAEAQKLINIFLDMIPPTSTGQMRKVRVVNGKPMFYEPEKVKEVRRTLTGHLMQYKPDEPLTGPLELRVLWLFPAGKSHHDGEWRVTRPDTDNLEKILKDCMTALGYWTDDAQVAVEHIEKKWTKKETGIQIEVNKL